MIVLLYALLRCTSVCFGHDDHRLVCYYEERRACELGEVVCVESSKVACRPLRVTIATWSDPF
jgi:hypothetical protein